MTRRLAMAWIALAWAGAVGGATAATPREHAPEALHPLPDRDTVAAEVAAVRSELDRGLVGLSVPNAPSPYFAEARWTRAFVWSIAASYGGLTRDLEERQQVAAVRVRVGSPTHDDSGLLGSDDVAARFDPGIESSPTYLAHRTWLAQDASFRAAIRAFSRKEGILARLSVDVPVPDYGPGPGPTVRLEGGRMAVGVDTEGLAAAVRRASQRFARFPSIDNGEVHVAIVHEHRIVATTEDLAFDRTLTRAIVAAVADTQAPDGMRIDHGRAIHLHEIPTPGPDFDRQVIALTDRVLTELEALASAPMIDEAYDGPLLFLDGAAAQLLATLIPSQAHGVPPPLSESGRVLELEPAWQRRLGKNVLPPFLSLVDDPERDPFGSYPLDAEGFVPQRIRLVDRGTLTSLLMTRTPGRELRRSNGHARATPALDVGPQISNLVVEVHGRARSQRELERELLRRAREDGYDYAYVVESLRDDVLLGPPPRDSAATLAGTGKVSLPLPARLWRIEAGGRRTLVRGAMLAPVAIRVLRRIRAVGRRAQVHRLRLPVAGYGAADAQLGLDAALSHTVDVTVTTPALLVDGLEILVERGERERPPVLAHPLRDDDATAAP
ncbi:MAG: hypothetical protein D6705_07655 [Deltaproteobacteria bacterium]|nr:MAG: hypothetical protein D6705_07655 [Deltaproteobacteria bacterium]